MEQIVGAVGAIIIFGLIVFVHELGHFLAAKRSGMTVYDFSLGFGPAIFQRKVGETLYAIRAIPFGGFVRIAGMELEDFDEEDGEGGKKPRTPDPNGFNTKPLYARFATIIAGVTMNVMLALIVFIVIGIAVGYPDPNGPAIIESFPKVSPAASAGLKVGDVITEINGHNDVALKNAANYIRAGGKQLVITYTRDGNSNTIHLQPTTLMRPEITGIRLRLVEYQGIGISMTSKLVSVNPLRAIQNGMADLVGSVQFGLANVTYIFSGQAKFTDIGGPLTVFRLAYDTSRTAMNTPEGMARFLNFLATFNVLIAVFNVLPLPALDGGHLLFLIVEGIYRRPIDRKKIAWIHAAGFILLLGFIAVISIKDILSWTGIIK